MLVSIGKVAKLIGVSISTLRRWEQDDYLYPESRTPGGHRRYKLSHIKEIFLGEKSTDRINLAYARVSSSDQRSDLQRQADLIVTSSCARLYGRRAHQKLKAAA